MKDEISESATQSVPWQSAAKPARTLVTFFARADEDGGVGVHVLFAHTWYGR